MKDARKNAELNGVWLRREPAHADALVVVSWDEAFPRPYWNDPEHWAACRPQHEKEED